MDKKRHKLLDNPILGYFLLAIYGGLFSLAGTYLDVIIGMGIKGYAGERTTFGVIITDAKGVGNAFTALIAFYFFYRYFSPEFKGVFRRENFFKGLAMIAPFLLAHYAGSFISWYEFGAAGIFIALLRALAPGFGSEIVYRGLGISNYMRTIRSEGEIMPIFFLSSLTYTLIRIIDIIEKENSIVLITLTFYIVGTGMLFGAVFIRTANIWTCIFAHLTINFLEYARLDVEGIDGTVGGMGIGDWVTAITGICGIFLSLYLMRSKHHKDIMRIWRDRWSISAEAKQ